MSCFVVTCRQMVGYDLSKVCNSWAMKLVIFIQCMLTHHDVYLCKNVQHDSTMTWLSVALAALHAFKHNNGNAHAKIPHNWYPSIHSCGVKLNPRLTLSLFCWVGGNPPPTQTQQNGLRVSLAQSSIQSWKLVTVSTMRTTHQSGNFIRNDKTVTKWKQQAFIEQITTKWINLSCRRRQPKITITRNLYPFFTPLM